MNPFSNRMTFAVTVALMLSVSGMAWAAPARPFKAKGETTVSGDPFAPGATTLGSGTATHLGKFVSVGTLLLIPAGDGLLFGSGTQTYIAANGDELETTFSGFLDPVSGEGNVTSIVTGGTGRFADATGEFEADVFSVPPATFTFTAEGKIKY